MKLWVRLHSQIELNFNFIAAKKMQNKNVKVNWEKQTAHDVDRQCRALSVGVTRTVSLINHTLGP